MIAATKSALTVLPLLLAESTTAEVKSSALGEWLIIGAAVLVIVQVGWNFLDRVRGDTSQKREVSFVDKFATSDQHEELREQVAQIDKERRISVAILHEKIDATNAIAAEIKGQLTGFNQQLQQINIHLINRASK